jgi:hypothetical protein
MEQQGIILTNINLDGISKLEQSMKADEELEEFHEAYLKYIYDKTEENKNHVIEEWHDRNQAELGLLEKEGITAQEVMEGYPKHSKKIKNRPRIKQCSKCIRKTDCKLYLHELWEGQQEAEKCGFYKEQEE